MGRKCWFLLKSTTFALTLPMNFGKRAKSSTLSGCFILKYISYIVFHSVPFYFSILTSYSTRGCFTMELCSGRKHPHLRPRVHNIQLRVWEKKEAIHNGNWRILEKMAKKGSSGKVSLSLDEASCAGVECFLGLRITKMG